MQSIGVFFVCLFLYIIINYGGAPHISACLVLVHRRQKQNSKQHTHHHFSFSGSVSPKSCVPCMLVCPLRPPLLTSDWLGCCCWCSDLIGFDSRPPDTGSRPVAVIVVLVDKLDMGCWEETSGGLLMCVVGGGGAGPCPP